MEARGEEDQLGNAVCIHDLPGEASSAREQKSQGGSRTLDAALPRIVKMSPATDGAETLSCRPVGQ